MRRWRSWRISSGLRSSLGNAGASRVSGACASLHVQVLELLATYADRHALLREYPFLKEEDLRQALSYAAAVVDDDSTGRPSSSIEIADFTDEAPAPLPPLQQASTPAYTPTELLL